MSTGAQDTHLRLQISGFKRRDIFLVNWRGAN